MELIELVYLLGTAPVLGLRLMNGFDVVVFGVVDKVDLVDSVNFGVEVIFGDESTILLVGVTVLEAPIKLLLA